MSNTTINDALNVSVQMHDAKSAIIVRFTRYIDTSNREDRNASQNLQHDLNAQWVEAVEGFVAQLTPESTKWLHEHYPNAQYDEVAEVLCKASRMLLVQAERRANAITAFLKDGTTPAFDYPTKREPRKHQRLATWCLVNSRFMALQHDMGTGKTQSMIDALSIMARQHDGKNPLRVCIILPRAILVNWVRELDINCTVDYKVAIGTWLSARYRSELKQMNCVAFGHGEMGATEALLELVKQRDCKMQILILNYDTLKTRVDLLKKVNFDVCILDEGHKIKNYTAKRTKMAIELAETCARRYILTGTPITQGPNDLFSQYEFMGPQLGLLGYTTYYAYQHAYCKFGGRNGAQVTGTQNMGKLLNAASRWSFTLKKEQCIDLPPKVYETRQVEMTSDQSDIYDQVCSEVLIALESLGAEVTVQNILVQYLRLAQCSSGYLKTVDGREVPIGATPKIDALMELLEDEGYPKVVVWTRFIHELHDIEDALRARGVRYVSYHGDVKDSQRQEAIDSFQNDDDVKVFIGTATSGGVGITLTAASMVVYVSNTFSLGDRLQSEDRVHRIGQTKSVTYVDIVCEDTIDELVLKRLSAKREVANFFNDPQELATSLKSFLQERMGK